MDIKAGSIPVASTVMHNFITLNSKYSRVLTSIGGRVFSSVGKNVQDIDFCRSILREVTGSSPVRLI